jgi:hypothetical protein
MIRKRVSYANVTATLALVLAIAGGALAVQGIPDRTGVFHGCVNKRSGALRLIGVGQNCRSHGKKAEFLVTWNQRGRNGVNGADGRPGINGNNGTNGTNGATNVVVRTSQASTDAHCNPGEVATGGGGIPDNAAITDSHPTPTSGTPTGWHATEGSNGSMFQFQIDTYVVCASP